MSEEIKEPASKNKFQVVSVEKTDPPEGIPSGSWYRYVIGKGGSKIEGLKLGTLKAVTEHAEAVAEDLNTRATKGTSTYAPRQKKQPTAT